MTATALFSSAAAADDQHELVRTALHSQRERLAGLLATLDADEWHAPSRCTEWTVHEVARHLCDATLRCTQLLRGEQPADSEGFDPRSTPNAWLVGSAGEHPDATRDRFEDGSAALVHEVDRHLRDGTDACVPFLYGPVPWSVAVLHVVWDAWVHERDIVLPLGREHAAPPVECGPVAAYGLALAGGASVMLHGTAIDERFVLGDDGFRLEVDNVPAVGPQFRVTIDDDAIDAEPLRGDLAAVVDSLAGRDGELGEVLHGPPERVGRLGVFRAFLLLPT